MVSDDRPDPEGGPGPWRNPRREAPPAETRAEPGADTPGEPRGDGPHYPRYGPRTTPSASAPYGSSLAPSAGGPGAPYGPPGGYPSYGPQGAPGGYPPYGPQGAPGGYPPYGPQPPAGPYGPYGPYGDARRGRPPGGRTNGLAIASLVLSLVGLCGIGSIVAIFLGYSARRQIRDSWNQQSGDGLALAGIIIGWIGLVLAIVYAIFVFRAFAHLQTNPPTYSTPN